MKMFRVVGERIMEVSAFVSAETEGEAKTKFEAGKVEDETPTCGVIERIAYTAVDLEEEA